MNQSPVTRLEEKVIVFELIHDISPCWKEKLIRELFFSEEANIIKSISLSPWETEDQQVWNYSRIGQLTVKSA